MTNIGISIVAIVAAGFCAGALWLSWEAVHAPRPPRWEDYADRCQPDRQYQGRIEAGAQSFRDALALSDNECAEYVSANSDKPIMTYGDWPSITEEELVSIHSGDKQ